METILRKSQQEIGSQWKQDYLVSFDSINLQNNLRVGDGKRIISQGCAAEHRNSFAICFGLLQHFLGYLTWTQLTLALQQHFSLRSGQTKPAALICST